MSEVRFDLAQVVFWDGEDDGDGLDLGDDGEGGAAAGLDDVARVDEAQTDAAGNG